MPPTVVVVQKILFVSAPDNFYNVLEHGLLSNRSLLGNRKARR